MLVDAGVLTRRHGRGTYVAGALTSPGKIRNFRFLADDGVSLLAVYSRLLSMKRITASRQWAQFFPRETKLVFISRLFSVNLEFQSYAEAYLPEKRFGKLLDIPARELDGSALTHMLQERFNAPALNVTHRLTQRILPEDACRHIGIERGTLGMIWEIIGRSFRAEVIFYQRFYMPPTTRTIEINPFTQAEKEGS